MRERKPNTVNAKERQKYQEGRIEVGRQLFAVM